MLILFVLALFLGINSTSAANVTADQVANASETVKTNIETNHVLPNNVNVSGNVMNMSNYLGVSTTAILNINNNNSNITINIKSFGGAPSPSEIITARNINKTEYLDIASRVRTYMDTNGRAPNYATQTSTGSTIRYESLAYMFSQILNSYKTAGVLPDYITVNPWSTVSNSSTIFFSLDQINTAAGNVKSFKDINNRLPNYVTISGTQVSMPSFLKLSTTILLNINANLNVSIALKICGNATNTLETIKSEDIGQAEYLDIASRVKSFMDSNGNAPNYASTSLGKIRYESLVYMFSQILNSYKTNNKTLPNYITVYPWVNGTNVIGSTDRGYVEKLYYGNQSSNQTIVLIIGVHPQENGIHTAIYNALENKSENLSKRYVLYYVHVTKDADNYSEGRMNGQLLSLNIVVPDVPSENPILVMDNHENHGADSGYDYYRFLYPISNTTITTTYANDIINQMPFLVIYYPPNPTSPPYVTEPLAEQGITTMIYETYAYDSITKKISDANALIDSLDII